MRLTDKLYKALKWNVLIFLPALTTFVGQIGQAFEWHFLPDLLVIMTSLTAFLGTLIGVSSVQYHIDQENEEL